MDPRGKEIPRDPELNTRTGDSRHAGWENTNLTMTKK